MTKAPQPTPKQDPPEPVRVPNATDPDVEAARKLRAAQEFANRKGRESTRLATPTGDPAYARTALG